MTTDNDKIDDCRPVIVAAHGYLQKPGNEAGGNCHIALDDGNLTEADIRYCLDVCTGHGDAEGAELMRQFLRLSMTQRLKVIRDARSFDQDERAKAAADAAREARTKYLLITVEDAQAIAFVLPTVVAADGLPFGGKQSEQLKRIRARLVSDTGGDFEEIAQELKKLAICGACAIEGQASGCMSLQAQFLGRRLKRLIDRANPTEGKPE